MTLWSLDEGLFLDADAQSEVLVSVDISAPPFTIGGAFSQSEVKVKVDVTMVITQGIALDLLDLIPETFTTAPILISYVREASIQVGDWFTKVANIIKLLSPNTTTSTTYLRELGSIIGVTFPPEDETTDAEMRKVLENAVSWYKVKGTYESLSIIALIYQVTINIFDMYTNDYVTFFTTDWFVGDEGENPPGFDDTFYKSPHFGLEIVLNKTYTIGSLTCLWPNDTILENFSAEIERTRPVHTVPHYMLLLNPVTDELGNTIRVAGNIDTKVTADWASSTKFFDEVGSGDAWFFDDGTFFDSEATAAIKSITKWVMGTGNSPCNIDDSGFFIESQVLTGTIAAEDIVITDEKVTFEFDIPEATVQASLTSVGLFIPGAPDLLMVASCFPCINKSSAFLLRVKVEVFRKDLSS